MSATLLVSTPPSADDSEALSSAEPFAGLPASVLKQIAGIAETRTYLAGEIILAPGQDDGEFFFVVTGRLKASCSDSESGSMLVEEVGAGGFLGLVEALAPEASRMSENMTVSAEADSTVLAINCEAFSALVAKRPSLSRNLAKSFAATLAQARFRSAADDSSPQRRVFTVLMEYIVRDAISGSWRIPQMPKHRELAEKAGAEEHDAADAVARLIREGVARRDYPGLIIDDMAQLTRLAS